MRASFARLSATLRSLCYRPGFTDTHGDSPAALGNRIAAAAIAYGRTDGSLEGQHYLDPSFTAANEPLVVGQPGAPMHDRTFWQPLALGQVVVQGGLPVPAKVQSFVGSQWGRVRAFALPKDMSSLDPGPPPTGDPSSAAYKRAAVDAIRARARGQRKRRGHDARGLERGRQRRLRRRRALRAERRGDGSGGSPGT